MHESKYNLACLTNYNSVLLPLLEMSFSFWCPPHHKVQISLQAENEHRKTDYTQNQVYFAKQRKEMCNDDKEKLQRNLKI